MKKLLLYGDSVMKGIILDELGGRYTLYQSRLQDLLADQGIELDKRCRFGATLDKGYELWQKDRERGLAADAVLLEFGGNDCDFDWGEVAAAPEIEHQPQTPPALFCRKLRAFVEDLRASGARPLLMTLPPIDSRRFAEAMARRYGVKLENILRYTRVMETMGRFQALYSDLIKDVAYAAGADLLDVRAAYLADVRADSWIGPDGMHATPEGHEVLARLLADGLHRLGCGEAPSSECLRGA